MQGEYKYESGTEEARRDVFLAKNDIHTFLISPDPEALQDVNNVYDSLSCFAKIVILSQAEIQKAPDENNIITEPVLERSVKNCFPLKCTQPYQWAKIFQVSYIEFQPYRKNFMMNSMEQFRDIMKQTNIEMEQELDRMPIGNFQ